MARRKRSKKPTLAERHSQKRREPRERDLTDPELKIVVGGKRATRKKATGKDELQIEGEGWLAWNPDFSRRSVKGRRGTVAGSAQVG